MPRKNATYFIAIFLIQQLYLCKSIKRLYAIQQYHLLMTTNVALKCFVGPGLSQHCELAREQNRLIVSKNQELNKLNHIKDKFFSIIGHDLGNQFNIIHGFLEVLVSVYRYSRCGE